MIFDLAYLMFFSILLWFVEFQLAFFYNKSKKEVYDSIISILNDNCYYGYSKKEWLIVYNVVKIGYLVIISIIAIAYIILIIILIYRIKFSYLFIFTIPIIVYILIYSYKLIIIFIDLNKIGKENIFEKYKSIKTSFIDNRILKLILKIIRNINYYNQCEIGNIVNYFFIISHLAIFICGIILIIGGSIKALLLLI